MDIQTHNQVDPGLVGQIVEIKDGRAIAQLVMTAQMGVDERGLVHGGFVFGLADYAAMVAVNDPNVVLGAADARFVAPVRVGDVVVATARVLEEKGKKRVVECIARVDEREVFTGTFTAFVLEHHVFDV